MIRIINKTKNQGENTLYLYSALKVESYISPTTFPDGFEFMWVLSRVLWMVYSYLEEVRDEIVKNIVL